MDDNVSEDEKILADLLLFKMPIGEARYTYHMYNTLMNGQHENFSPETFDRLAKICQGNPGGLRTFLLSNGYIDCVDPRYPQDKLTEKGRIAQEKGGHLKYKEWEELEAKKTNIEEFPKKKWYIYEPLKWAVFFILGAVTTKLMCSSTRENNDQKPSQVKEQPRTYQTPTKTLNKTDTVK